MDEFDQFFGTGLFVSLLLCCLGGGRAQRSFVMEAIEVAAGFLEVFDPAMGLCALNGGLVWKFALNPGID